VKRRIPFFLTSAFIGIGLGTSSAAVITFNSIAHGEAASTQIPGLTISAENFSFDAETGEHPNLSLGFDTGETGTADPDLEGPAWAGGNLAPAVLASLELGTAIIIAENDVDEDENGIIDSPDDEGNRPAGVITFELDDPVSSVGFDLIDVEGVVEEPGNLATFLMGGAVIASIPFSEFLPGGMHDQGAVFGNNTVNRIAPIGGLGPFDEIEIHLGGSAAVDNLVFDMPSPGVAGLLALGLGLLGLSRRRG